METPVSILHVTSLGRKGVNLPQWKKIGVLTIDLKTYHLFIQILERGGLRQYKFYKSERAVLCLKVNGFETWPLAKGQEHKALV